MNVNVLWIAIGGAIGAAARYGLGQMLASWTSVQFPIATFAANVSGCFLAGMLFGLAERQAWMQSGWRNFLIPGFCGGFTTFSAFGLENLYLLRQGMYGVSLLYAFASLGFGILACVAGYSLVRSI